MEINGRKIGEGAPYIVAEISGNHCGDYFQCSDLISAAAWAGADAVKVQCYTPATITLDCDKPDFVIQEGPWKGRTFYELYQKAHTPFEWFHDLFQAAKVQGITLFSSIFDKTSVDMLEKLECPAYKIASMECVDIPLIKYAGKTGKPLIISTGMASGEEILEAIRAVGHENFCLLHCVSGYPTRVEEANLWRIEDLRRLPFRQARVGLSDHTKGIEVPIAATALGAVMIEKHIKNSNTISEDSKFSLAPKEFKVMSKAVRSVWGAMLASEPKSQESSKQYRRSLYVVKDTKKGEIFTQDNIRSIRPNYGLPPIYFDDILGKKAAQDIERGTALKWDLIAS